MKDQLITFETAKLAKKKGCNILPELGLGLVFYNKLGRKDTVHKLYNASPSYKEKSRVKEDEMYPYVTQSVLQKWLREGQKKWDILVYVIPFFSKESRQEQCFIWRRGVLIALEPKAVYEESLEEGLQEALKLI